MKKKKMLLDEHVVEAAKSCRKFDESVRRTAQYDEDVSKIVRRDLQEAFDILENLRKKFGPQHEADITRLWKLISR